MAVDVEMAVLHEGFLAVERHSQCETMVERDGDGLQLAGIFNAGVFRHSFGMPGVFHRRVPGERRRIVIALEYSDLACAGFHGEPSHGTGEDPQQLGLRGLPLFDYEGSFEKGRQPFHEVLAAQAGDLPAQAWGRRQGEIERLTTGGEGRAGRQSELLGWGRRILTGGLCYGRCGENGGMKIASRNLHRTSTLSDDAADVNQGTLFVPGAWRFPL
jgi:hypothetical protein